jgi:hypothetical protein
MVGPARGFDLNGDRQALDIDRIDVARMRAVFPIADEDSVRAR